jgi:hypothetical protein
MVRCDSLLTRRLESPGFASLCHQRVRPVHPVGAKLGFHPTALPLPVAHIQYAPDR